jgi:rhamnosyltransferase
MPNHATERTAPAIERSDVAAAVVTYHPDGGRVPGIEAIRAQVDAVVVVDNGSGPPWADVLADPTRLPPDVCAIPNPENLGVAAALNQACRWAMSRGYRWLLLLDQDSVPAPDLIDQLAAAAAETPADPPFGILAANYRDATGVVGVAATGPGRSREAKVAITSGSLLRLDAYLACGPFRDDFFIDEVDHEYCLRLRRNGWSVRVTREPLLTHALGEQRRIDFGVYKPAVSGHAPVRRYYSARNRVALAKGYLLHEPVWVAGRLAMLGLEAVGILLFETHRRAKLGAVVRGLRDGITGRMGPAASRP